MNHRIRALRLRALSVHHDVAEAFVSDEPAGQAATRTDEGESAIKSFHLEAASGPAAAAELAFLAHGWAVHDAYVRETEMKWASRPR